MSQDTGSTDGRRRTNLLVRGAVLLVLLMLFAPFVDARFVPFVKWPLYLTYAFMAWVFAQFLKLVWENRYHDKFAVGFVALLILLMLFSMWDILTHWP